MSSIKELCICGIGPGHPDYILPVVYNEVQAADLLVGAQRHLDIFRSYNKSELLFKGKLTSLKDDIDNKGEGKIVVLVSGDTGFHSLRRFLKSSFGNLPIRCFPGISSFQYLYAKLGLGYENAFKGSLHGTSINFLDRLEDFESVFLLTDNINDWRAIARLLVDNGYGALPFHVGDRLSYPEETIVSTTAEQVVNEDYSFGLCSVIVESKANNLT